MFLKVLLFISFLSYRAICKQCLNKGEYELNDYCFKLIQLNNSETISYCENIFENFNQSNNNSLVDRLNCANLIGNTIKKIIKIYANNLKLSELYDFGVLPVRENKLIFKLSSASNFTETMVFTNHFKFKNYQYIDGISVDEKPSVMINEENNEISNLLNQNDNNCVYSLQSNGSFKFYLGDCNKKMPFICVKQLKMLKFTEDESAIERCSSFNKVLKFLLIQFSLDFMDPGFLYPRFSEIN